MVEKDIYNLKLRDNFQEIVNKIVYPGIIYWFFKVNVSNLIVLKYNSNVFWSFYYWYHKIKPIFTQNIFDLR